MDSLKTVSKGLIESLGTKVFGQAKTIEDMVITLLCGGHALLTGSPGVAKTTLVRNLASCLGYGYKRIQFTPDLTPFDILGGDTLQFDGPDNRKVVFTPGPLFAPFVLADEINRASPRTQAALLEAMQERQVSTGGTTRNLPHPFFVFATQNPIENEGTFPLPEAQLDRFLMNIVVPYPDFAAEISVAQMDSKSQDCAPLQNGALLGNARDTIGTVPMSKALIEAAVRIVRYTRPEESKTAKAHVNIGASPRAAQALVLTAKARAFLQDAREVNLDHVLLSAPSVLRHRLVLNFNAVAQKLSADDVIQLVLKDTVL